MAGVKGRSGGARPGAGRPPSKRPVKPAKIEGDPVVFLMSVVEDPNVDVAWRIRAAGLAAQYLCVRRADIGLKREAQKAAIDRAAGKFAATTMPPKLVVNNK